ncbi:MAG TPA: hypothetical protein VFW96_11085 [Thermomicrobiales bacterium]|nr:hypothetical protein [Thermomicrobiales bacterium]
MAAAAMDERWVREAEAVLTGFKEWRLQHLRATLTEIEAALDARLAALRARLLEDAALASAAADLAALPEAARPRCPACGRAMAIRGPAARRLTTTYEQPVTLRRHYAVCAACGEALSPPG